MLWPYIMVIGIEVTMHMVYLRTLKHPNDWSCFAM